ncbi:MAG TPA: ABC transporter permease [Candidatus Acidoferrum sp.]|jgi:putative ABC transport system permease protein|nr:ABC transporter permease [Candidatus Acidoferrum sp.]
MTDRTRQLLYRLISFFRHEQLDRDLDVEVSAHLELAVEENLRRGLSPAEARRQALLRFGGAQQAKESHRDARSLPLLETLFQDIRYSLRILRKSRGFTAMAILTLAFGIGTNTAIFSMVNALLLHPYRFRNLDSLVLLWENRGIDEGPDARSISPGDAADLANSQLFDDIATYQCGDFNLSSEGRVDVARGCRVSANFFSVLGVGPAEGRLFAADEEQPGSDESVVLSDGFWQARFASDPHLVGKTIRLNGRNYTVAGIMPPDFDYPVPMELWVPLALGPAQRSDRSQLSLAALARLKPGASVAQAAAALKNFSHRLSRLYPRTNAGRVLSVLQLRKELYLYSLPLFLLLQAAAVFVLLLACANLASLLFARMIARQKELAVRSALGANRSRLARLLVSEMSLLALVGGAVAVAASFLSVRVLRNSISPDWTKWVPGWDSIEVDSTVLFFTVLLSVLLGLFFGLVTALHLRHINLNTVMKEAGRGSAGPARGHLRNGLVAAQVALALILLVCAGLTMQGFNRLAQAYQGFQPWQVLKFEVALPESTYPEGVKRSSFFQTALRAVASLPGVSDAALTSNLPASNVDNEKTLFTIQGRPALESSEAPAADLETISRDYFSVLKIPLIAGRFFTEADNASSAHVAIISRTMANRFWPSDPVGQRCKLGAADSSEPWMTVVGVVGDARQNWWNPATFPVIYQPYLQASRRSFRFVLRTASDPAGYASAARTAIAQVDPEIPVTELKTLASEVQDSIAIVHIMGVLMAIFGIVALLLSSIGVYGILSENVAERTHEFGIRFALGANPRDVLRLVLRHALTVSGIGLAIGLPISFAVSRAMAAFVFGIVSVSLPVLLSLAGLLLIVALVAAYFPARRALRVDPIVALRYE